MRGDLRLVEVLQVAGKEEICSARVSAVLFFSFNWKGDWRKKRSRYDWRRGYIRWSKKLGRGYICRERVAIVFIAAPFSRIERCAIIAAIQRVVGCGAFGRDLAYECLRRRTVPEETVGKKERCCDIAS